MTLLSTGQESTLGSYRQMAAALFGQDSPAVKFLDEKIAEQGANEQVIQHESQMVFLLASMHFGSSDSAALPPDQRAGEGET